MFKICMQNYFRSLKYVFVALGVIFIALILGAQTTVTKSVREVKTMIESVEETTESSDLSLDRIGDSFTSTFESIGNIFNPDAAAKEETEESESIVEAFAGVLGNYAMYIGEVLTFAASAVVGIIIAILLFFVILIAGIILGSILITMFGRYEIKHDNIFRIIFEQIVRIFVLIVWLGVNLVILICVSVQVGIIVAALLPLVYTYIALFSTWLTAGDRRRPLYGRYVTFKNMLRLLLHNVIQIAIMGVIVVLIYLVFGAVLAAVFAIALLMLTVSNVNLNAYILLYEDPSLEIPAAGLKSDAVIEGAQAAAIAGAQDEGENAQAGEGVKAEDEKAQADAGAKAQEETVTAEAAVAAGTAGTVAAAAAAENAAADDTAAETVTPAETLASAPSAVPSVQASAGQAAEIKPAEVQPIAVQAEEVKPAEVQPTVIDPVEIQPTELKAEIITEEIPVGTIKSEITVSEIKQTGSGYTVEPAKKETTVKIDIEE